MSIFDVLQQYQNGAPKALPQTPEHFETVAEQSDPNDVAQGLAHAFRDDQTPPFHQMVGNLFGNSNPNVRASVLGQLISSVGPALLGGLATGSLGRILGSRGNAGAPATITPEQAAQVNPGDVQELAKRAEQHDPSVVDRVSSVYAQHPQAVKALGGIALAIALGRIANRNQH